MATKSRHGKLIGAVLLEVDGKPCKLIRFYDPLVEYCQRMSKFGPAVKAYPLKPKFVKAAAAMIRKGGAR